VRTEGDHRHCKICGRVCDPEEDTCSKACAQKRLERLQTRRMYTYLMYGAIALLLIVLFARFL
jgi:predicted nucleic acid-binding Zn ribbon protein